MGAVWIACLGALLFGLPIALPNSALAQEPERRKFTPARPAEEPDDERETEEDEAGDEKPGAGDDTDDEEESPADEDSEGDGSEGETANERRGEDSTETTPTSTSPSATGTSDEGDEEGGGGEAPAAIEDPVAYCDAFMPTYLESAGRKLFRALSGEAYTLQKVQLQNFVDIRVEGGSGESQKVEFEVVREKEGRVAALVDSGRNYRRTLVAALTDSGPVVVSLRWPERGEIDQKSDCEPIRSKVLRPTSKVSGISVRPFKYWGIRVVWQIPNSFSDSDYDGPNMYQTLVDLLSTDED